jgi:hypothetical protein
MSNPTVIAPSAVHRRGAYFTGVEHLEATGLLLGPTFTISAWLRINGYSNIFSVSRRTNAAEGAEDFINFGDTEENKLYFTYSDG